MNFSINLQSYSISLITNILLNKVYCNYSIRCWEGEGHWKRKTFLFIRNDFAAKHLQSYKRWSIFNTCTSRFHWLKLSTKHKNTNFLFIACLFTVHWTDLFCTLNNIRIKSEGNASTKSVSDVVIEGWKLWLKGVKLWLIILKTIFKILYSSIHQQSWDEQFTRTNS